MPERFRRNGFSFRLPLLSAYAVALILSAMRYSLAVDNVSDIVIHIQVVIVSGFHLFPFRTEKLSPSAPMVLHTRGRVGSRRFSRRRDPVRNSRVSLLLFIFFGQGCLQGGLGFGLSSLTSLSSFSRYSSLSRYSSPSSPSRSSSQSSQSSSRKS